MLSRSCWLLCETFCEPPWYAGMYRESKIVQAEVKSCVSREALFAQASAGDSMSEGIKDAMPTFGVLLRPRETGRAE